MFLSFLDSMVMSNKRAGRQAAAERRGPEVKIPKEDLKECVDLGYSSTRIADKFSTSKHNVRRHLDMYKLGKARRFEILTGNERWLSPGGVVGGGIRGPSFTKPMGYYFT